MCHSKTQDIMVQSDKKILIVVLVNKIDKTTTMMENRMSSNAAVT